MEQVENTTEAKEGKVEEKAEIKALPQFNILSSHAGQDETVPSKHPDHLSQRKG